LVKPVTRALVAADPVWTGVCALLPMNGVIL
jgi:hypothetical protein